jgi:predicted dehydrogenase
MRFMTDKLRFGVIGCGAISGAYLKTAKNFEILECVACADLLREAAEAKAKEFDIPRVCSVDQLLADESIDVVLNLTIPKAHLEVALAAIESGKHVYNEKPLAANRAEAQQLMAAAADRNLRVGCAPDTFLGSGHQTARKLIDDGAIGKPVAAIAFMMGRGHESWHPNPEFYYAPGGGPMLDMGPYYMTDLVQLLGPIDRVSGEAGIMISPRVISHNKSGKQGKEIPVETHDHIAGNIRFESGVIGTIITSFAVMHAEVPRIQIFGTEGTLTVPDPNVFDGEVRLRKAGEKQWQVVQPTHPTGYQRAAGLADMAYAIAGDRPHRASGELAFHVLDAMEGFTDAAERGQVYHLISDAARPAAVPDDLPAWTFE